MEIPELTEKECIMLYYCADSRGISTVIKKDLNLSKEEFGKIVKKLTELGLIEKENDYYATEKGEDVLKYYANIYSIDN